MNENSMRIALVGDAFPPMRSSAAVQLRDLSFEFVRQGHQLSVIIPTSNLDKPWLCEVIEGVEVIRLRSPETKNIGFMRRAVAEFLMPYVMLRNMKKSPLSVTGWDGVVSYAPSIFLGPVANSLKNGSDCRNYLILRDMFPQWAVDMG